MVLAAPYVAHAALGAALPAGFPAALLKQAGQTALLPLLAGVALRAALPNAAAAAAPLASWAALALTAFACGSVLARHAQAALGATAAQLGAATLAVLAAQAGELE